MSRQIVIIGNGIAGITAARTLRKHTSDTITVISGESDHFFSRTALMYVYMGHMTYQDTKPYENSFWHRNRIDLLRAWVDGVDTRKRRVRLSGGRELPFDSLILASGSRSNRFGWPGQDLPGVQGLYSLQDLEQMKRNTENIDRGVIVGGGLIGVETAEMLQSRGIDVTFLVRESNWMDFAFPAEESTMIGEHIREHGVDLRLGVELDSILPGADGTVRAATTGNGDEIPCEFVALTVGVAPNIAFLDGSGIECDRGVLVDDYLRTSEPDVYAIGDCAQLRQAAEGRRPIEPVWYVGRAMGQIVGRSIAGHPTRYEPGPWFNSAKFFDLEWQVYGAVPPEPPEGQATFFWQHPSDRKSVRINYRTSDLSVTGFNVMGVRYRHEVCDRWLRDGAPITEVLDSLGAADFDPELYPQHRNEIARAWNERHPETPVRTRQRRRGLSALLGRARGA